MAYSNPIPFTNLRNKAGGKEAEAIANNTNGFTYSQYDLYTEDKATIADYPVYIGVESPAHFSLGEAKTAAGEGQEWHAQQFINKYKTMEILVNTGPYDTSGQSEGDGKDIIYKPKYGFDAKGAELAGGDPKWGNWRSYGKISVDPRIILYPKNKEFGFSYTTQYGKAFEKLSETTGLKKLSDAAEVARGLSVAMNTKGDGNSTIPMGGKFKSMFEHVPMWKTTDPIKFDGNLEFEFQFGKYGLFSGEHEVVRPILALASIFCPNWAPDDSGGVSSYILGPAPGGPQYLINFLGEATKEGKGLKGTLDKTIQGFATDGVVGAATELEKGLYNLVNDAIAMTLNGKVNDKPGGVPLKSIYVRMGRLIFGPLIVSTSSFKFDFSQVDEYGFPWKGTFSYTGLEQMYFPTPESFLGMFNGGT